MPRIRATGSDGTPDDDTIRATNVPQFFIDEVVGEESSSETTEYERPPSRAHTTHGSCISCRREIQHGDICHSHHDGTLCASCMIIDTECESCHMPHQMHNLARLRITESFNSLEWSVDGICQLCLESAREVRPRVYSYEVPRNPTLKSKELQSEKKGSIITDMRKFGIELEFMWKTASELHNFGKEIHGSFGIVHDGSLRTSDDFNGGHEIVSPPMQGKAGEEAIRIVAECAKNNSLGVNKTCGYHVHLHAPEFVRNPREDRMIIDDSKPQAKLTYVYVEGGKERRSTALPDYITNYRVEATPYRQERSINVGKGFLRLRNLFAFYSIFDDVFRAMQPKSRRFSRFCKAMSALYSFDEIMRCQHYADIEELWYRERRRESVDERKSGGKYDESRYSGLNLHVFFQKGNTIELRYHSPTLNAEKILRWVKIHQAVFTWILSGGFNTELLRQIANEDTNIKNKAVSMCKLLKLDTATTEYVTGRVKKFLDKGEDAEVSA